MWWGIFEEFKNSVWNKLSWKNLAIGSGPSKMKTMTNPSPQKKIQKKVSEKTLFVLLNVAMVIIIFEFITIKWMEHKLNQAIIQTYNGGSLEEKL